MKRMQQQWQQHSCILEWLNVWLTSKFSQFFTSIGLSVYALCLATTKQRERERARQVSSSLLDYISYLERATPPRRRLKLTGDEYIELEAAKLDSFYCSNCEMNGMDWGKSWWKRSSKQVKGERGRGRSSSFSMPALRGRERERASNSKESSLSSLPLETKRAQV